MPILTRRAALLQNDANQQNQGDQDDAQPPPPIRARGAQRGVRGIRRGRGNARARGTAAARRAGNLAEPQEEAAPRPPPRGRVRGARRARGGRGGAQRRVTFGQAGQAELMDEDEEAGERDNRVQDELPEQNQPEANEQQQQPQQEDADIALVTQLTGIVDQYRRGVLSKIDAVVAIGAAIPIDDRTSEDFLLPYRTFLGHLEQIDEQRDDAGRRATPLPPSRRPSIEPEGSRQAHQRGKAHEDLLNSITAIDPALADDPDMLWNSPDAVDLSRLSASHAKTLKMLKVYRANPKTFVQLALSKAHIPQMPATEWTKVARGETVDYEEIWKLLDSHVVVQRRQLEITNNITIDVADESSSTSAKKSNKQIASAADWMRVHTIVSRATYLLFKHREEELRNYGEHVLQLFYNQNDPQLVLHYDRAVRNKYSQENAFDLDNSGAYLTLWQSYFTPTGTGFNDVHSHPRSGSGISSRAGKSSSSNVANEICNNYNEGKCRLASCRRKHICNVAGCGKQHRASEHSSKV